MTMTARRAFSLVIAIAVALFVACAPPKHDSQQLTDGRSAQPTPPSTTPGPTPASVPDGGGLTLPREGAAAPQPTVTASSPARALVNGIAPTIRVTGTNFVARTVVELDGQAITTSFVSDGELRAALPASIMTTSGDHALTAFTSAPGGGRSTPATFTVENPIATMSDLTPNAALVAAGDTPVDVTGLGFVHGSQVTLGGAPLATKYVSQTQLSVVIPAAKLAAAGSAPVAVVNPSPGGGPSGAIAFTVANPTVTVSSITPSSAIVGSPATTLTLAGTGFDLASSVSFNGAAITTHYQSATSLTADVPASALAATGNFPVVVTNPAPGGGVSLPVTFSVGNPTPTIATLTPSTATAGDPPTTVTIDGTGFVASSQVTFDGAASATTYVSATEVTATLSAAQLASAGTIAVVVTNPAPGGGASSPATFTVNNPTPVLTSIAPASVPAGSGDTSLTAYGSKLVTGATVLADGAPLDTTYVSATELRATVPAAKLAASGSIAITVKNPDPGSSTSSAVTLAVTDVADAGAACDTTGADVVLAGPGASQTVPLAYALGPAPRFAYNPAEPTFYTCPVAQLSTQSSSYAGLVVVNSGTASALLEANAVCGANDDAFLAVYAGASHVPTADADREACTGYVANGTSGGGGLASTQSNGSSYCPGLTAANGGAITLAPCGRAVLLAQPYDVTQFTAPAQLAVSLSAP
jgi:hypothetical protein